MKNLYSLKLIFMLLLSANLSTALQAQNIKLIDVNKLKSSGGSNNQYSTMNSFAFLNGVFYFTADDGIHGSELWRTEATAEGTQLVKDINPGFASSSANDIIVSGDKIYFSAYDDTNGQELWVSDGTDEGTKLLADLNSGTASSNPRYLTDVNGTLFFIINDNYYDHLWKTDGTEAGTILVADFFDGNNPQQLVNVNGRLFFTLYNYYYDRELYTSDGTTAGTTLVTDINPFGPGYPSNLTPLNGLLYFAAYDGTDGKLWVSDGTAAGTHAVKNNNDIHLPVSTNGDIDSFATKNNVLYFQGITTSGYELCKYNPSDAVHNVVLVKDINPGVNSSYPESITNVNGSLFFTAQGSNGDRQLWKTDGTHNGTELVKDINPGGKNFYYGLIEVKGILMFVFSNDALGFELWKSDGTSAGTVLVKDISPGIYSSFPGYLTYKKGILLFSANDGTKGRELWRSDGTEDGTSIVKNINQTSTSSSYPFGFTKTTNNKIVFDAYNENYGGELWVTDGSNAGTQLVKDIYPGTFSSYPNRFTRLQNKTYFFASDDSGYHLGKTDGTEAGTSLFYDLNVNGYILNAVASRNLLYFSIYYFATNQVQLWRSDGTSTGTYIIKADISGYYDLNMTAVGKTLFFTNYDDVNGLELWKTEGSSASTKLVKDIFAGSNGSNPSNLFNFKGKLYFSAFNGLTYSNALWTSDGTETGTRLVKPIAVDYTRFAEANGKLFFVALNSITKGYELFATDGTSEGTQLLKDVYHGPASSFINSLISGDTLVYFMADDGRNGNELWKSNGTKEGTKLVKNITPGIDGSYFNQMVNANDKLFFTIRDTLWQSNGTSAGTHPVHDASLNGVTNIYNLTALGDSIYFSGFSNAAGNELYVGSASTGAASIQTITASALIAPNMDDAFTVKLLTNPVKDQLKFAVNVKSEQVAQVMIADAAGRILLSDKQTLSRGTNMFSYNTKAWMQGVYLIRIVTAKGSASLLKAVK